MVGEQADPPLVTRRVEHGRVDRPVLLVADRAAGGEVGVLTPVGVEAPTQADAQLVRYDRSVYRDRGLVLVVLGARQLDEPAPAVGAGVARDEVDRSGEGVAPVERALRTLDYLDPLHGVDVDCLDVAVVIDAVDEVGSARLDAELDVSEDVALAANHRAVVLPAKGLGETQAGREAGQRIDVHDAAFLERRVRERADRNGNLLEGLLGLAGGDDDFFERGLCLCGRGHCRSAYGRHGQADLAELEHEFPLQRA